MSRAEPSLRISSLEDAQDIEKISKIYSHSRDIDSLKPSSSERPMLVIITGSPGVGKTTQMHRFLQAQGLEANNFYQVSLDNLVEHVSAYRVATSQLYDALLKSKKGSPLDDKDYATLSGIYPTVISSKKADFGLPEAIAKISSKIEKSGEVVQGGMRMNRKHNMTKSKAHFERNRQCRQFMMLTKSLKNSARKGNAESIQLLQALKRKLIQITGKQSLKKSLKKLSNNSLYTSLQPVTYVAPPTLKQVPSNKKESLHKPISLHNQEPSKKKASNKESTLYNLNELRNKGFDFGVSHGVNIVYDTTLTASGSKVKDDIMPILEKYRKLSYPKYLIKIILVKASPETIQQRIRTRHDTMIYGLNSYIRAITPNLKVIEKMVEDGQKGFDALKTYFTSPNYKSGNNSTAYTSSDFEFIEIINE